MNALPNEPLLSSRAMPVREERRPVDLPGWLIRDDGGTSALVVRDLSYSGCKISCAEPLQRGERIRLSVLKRGIIDAEVRWRRGDLVGLLFASARPVRKHWPRKAGRVPLAAKVHVRRYGKLSYDVRIFDLSTHGCKLEFVDLPKGDEKLWIKLPGIESLEAQVCWLDGYTGGAQFVRALHPAVLSLLLTKLGCTTA